MSNPKAYQVVGRGVGRVILATVVLMSTWGCVLDNATSTTGTSLSPWPKKRTADEPVEQTPLVKAVVADPLSLTIPRTSNVYVTDARIGGGTNRFYTPTIFNERLSKPDEEPRWEWTVHDSGHVTRMAIIKRELSSIRTHDGYAVCDYYRKKEQFITYDSDLDIQYRFPFKEWESKVQVAVFGNRVLLMPIKQGDDASVSCELWLLSPSGRTEKIIDRTSYRLWEITPVGADRFLLTASKGVDGPKTLYLYDIEGRSIWAHHSRADNVRTIVRDNGRQVLVLSTNTNSEGMDKQTLAHVDVETGRARVIALGDDVIAHNGHMAKDGTWVLAVGSIDSPEYADRLMVFTGDWKQLWQRGTSTFQPMEMQPLDVNGKSYVALVGIDDSKSQRQVRLVSMTSGTGYAPIPLITGDGYDHDLGERIGIRTPRKNLLEITYMDAQFRVIFR